MTIAIEAERANSARKTGVEHYIKEVILELARIDQENTYLLYLRTAPEEWLRALPSNFHLKVLPFPLFWTQARLSWEFMWHKVDALWIPASALPIYHPKNSTVTIHDTAFLFFPEANTRFMTYYLRFSTWFAVKFARNIVAVSESTKRDLVKHYGVPQNKVCVIHHGYRFVPPTQNSQSELMLPDSYILYLGTLQPRKNLIALVDAFLQYKQQHPHDTTTLVCAGSPGWKSESIREHITQHATDVTYLGYVTDHDRFRLLSGARAYVLPSLYEGFGMPILEAFAAGVPVITSNVSSLPEVAGDAAVYFDPTNLTSMENAISKVLNDPETRSELIKKGTKRLEQFSWETCARQTLAAITHA